MNKGFKFFPQKLFTKPVKMLNISGSFFGMSKPSEIFYSVKDGSWNDVSVWETVSGRVGKIPSLNDDVYIHTMINCVVGFPFKCNNLFITTTGVFSGNSVTGIADTSTVFGNLKCDGRLLATNNIELGGLDNYIDMSKTQSLGVLSYNRFGDQPIMPITHNVLRIAGPSAGSGKKYLTANTTCASFSTGVSNSYFEIGPYDFTCLGTFSNQAYTSCTGNGKITFVGAATFIQTMVISGAPDIEFRGGITQHPAPVAYAIIFAGQLVDSSKWSQSGFGQIRFTTNNQNITLTNFIAHCPIIVDAGITVTLTAGSLLQLNDSLNGVHATTSQFINKGTVYFNNVSNFTMATGVFDKDTFANVVGYIFNGSITLPYTTYQGLYIAGTGIKTQASGTNTIATTLNIVTGATLTSAGNTSVGGVTTLNGTLNLTSFDWQFNGINATAGSPLLTKTGAGNILWTGTINFLNGGISFTGNPNVEVRNGFTLANFTNVSGTGTWNFTTNSQTITLASILYAIQDMVITGAITITNASSTGTWQINNSLDGTAAGSSFINKGRLYFNTTNAPFATAGSLDYLTFNTNTIGYVMDANFTLPSTSYWGLYISGKGAFTKTLSGNTTIQGVFTMAHTGTNSVLTVFDLSTYDFTVNGTSSISGNGFIRKASAGNILFLSNVAYLVSTFTVDFSGAVNTEYRNGLQLLGTSGGAPAFTGTNTIVFSTNNQAIFVSNLITANFGSNNLLISGAITLSHTFTSNDLLTLNGTITGNNAASKFDNQGTTNYKNAAQPMLTGLLECNAAANTWIYGNGNQAVKGGTYRTLTLNGTGVKTLQGNVVVATLYTLTAPATLNLNGFTRT
jgi:hypothetical protein